jgi:DNA (cytosine-5)-methyltransferase 1
VIIYFIRRYDVRENDMNCLTLFSNVGIDEFYLPELGINVVLANELEKDRAKFYSKLHPNSEMVQGDILNKDVYELVVRKAKEKDVQLVIATPPCQGMSIANAKRSDKNDPRNSLIKRVVDVIKDIEPSHILIENVAGMAKTYITHNNEQVNIIDYLEQNIPSEYHLEYKVLDCADYGTPQSRKRIIVLISKEGRWNHSDATEEKITVRQAIGHLPSIEAGEDSGIAWHTGKNANEKHISWMKNTPSGKTAFENYGKNNYYPQIVDRETGDIRQIKGFKTTYKRISWDKPAPAVTMMNGSINSQNNVHPGRLKEDGTYSDARVLSVRELLILCGLPENFLDNHLEENENFIRKVLGECFPPKFCRAMMTTLPKTEEK